MFFFFQAEDGIRDGHVTGVQTCALPISLHAFEVADAIHQAIEMPEEERRKRMQRMRQTVAENNIYRWEIGRASCRKECRSGWSPYDEKKKNEDVGREI